MIFESITAFLIVVVHLSRTAHYGITNLTLSLNCTDEDNLISAKSFT